MAAFRFSCPSCQRVLQGNDTLRGKQVRCPTCQNVIPVPAASASEQAWYVARNKTKEGPYTTAQLKQLAASGQLRPQDMVLREGHDKWLPASAIKGLLPASSTPPVAVVAGPSPSGGSKPPMAMPLNGEKAPAARPSLNRRPVLWPWVVGAAAGVVVVAGITFGVLTWTGFFTPGPARPPGQASGNPDDQGSSPPARSKMDLSYIAAEFNGALVVHPRRILKSPVLGIPTPEAKIQEMVQETGIDPRKVDQVVVLIEPLVTADSLPKQAAHRPEPRERPEITLVQYQAGEATRPKTPVSSARDQAVAWLRANNAFGPRHRLVEQLAKGLDEVDGGKAFFLRLGTKLVKSHKPTLLAGRNRDFQAFEVPPELAGKWIAERLTEFKTTAPLEEVVAPTPQATLNELKVNNASGLAADDKVTGFVTYQVHRPLEGSLALRLTYMAGEYTHTRYCRAGAVAGEKGTVDFTFPALQVKEHKVAGLVPVFVELCSFASPDQRRKPTVLSNARFTLVKILDGSSAEPEEQQAPPRRKGGTVQRSSPGGVQPRKQQAAPPPVVPFSLGGVIRFSEPVDGLAILQKNLGKTETREHAGKKYLASVTNKFAGGAVAGYVADERTLVVGFESTLRKMLSAADAPSPLRERLSRLDLDQDVTGVILPETYLKLVAPLLSMASKSLPPDLADLGKLPAMVKAISMTASLSGAKLLELTLEADSADSAAALKRMADGGLNFLKAVYPLARPKLTEGVPPEGAPMLLAIADQINAKEGITIRQDGTAVTLTLNCPAGLLPGGTLAVDPSITQRATRMQVGNSLKQLALSMHTYHDANKGLPMPAIIDRQGKPLLSWRVALLPMLEEIPLYQQFKLDEPWDSPHNIKLLPRMPKIFAAVMGKPSEPYSTYYQVFVGGGAAFEPGKQLSFSAFPDGLSNTILIAEAAEAVPWTKPADLPYRPGAPLPRLGGHLPGGFYVAFADGSAHFFMQNCDPQELRAAITRAGGEIIHFEKLEQK